MEKIVSNKMAHNLECLRSANKSMTHNLKWLCHARRTTLIALAHNHAERTTAHKHPTLSAQQRTTLYAQG